MFKVLMFIEIILIFLGLFFAVGEWVGFTETNSLSVGCLWIVLSLAAVDRAGQYYSKVNNKTR